MTGGKVVILGRTGRNFAAGMTGGIAYVYDKYDKLERRLNPADVNLESLSIEDINYVKSQVEKHLELTGSPKAEEFLSDFDQEIVLFKKVMPTDYKRVLEEEKMKLETQNN
jgi:glutamate synthase (NADPH/NADH) large chain